MPSTKPTAATLHRLLLDAPDPLYVLDAKRTIIFCNEACADWLGVKLADLLGRRVDYVAGDPTAGAPGVAAGLCPPPEAFHGRQTVGHVSCLARSGRLVHRRARFLPLGQGESECEGIVAFVDPTDLHAREMSRDLLPEERPDQLHLELRRFRASQLHRYGLEQLLGTTPAMKQVRAKVALAAQSQTPVLIVGPPGSGREHVARSIYYHSTARRQGKLLPVEAGLPNVEMLRQSFLTLAGEEPGATPGTLLLLEADTLPEAAQLLLAELLVETPRPPAVLATARKPLGPLVADGFHEELACQLSTLEIRLPPLAERLADLPLLVQAFLEQLNERGEKQLGGATPEVLDLLALHVWPGNLDELAEVLAAAHAAAATHEITVEDLPPRVRHAAHAAAYPLRKDEPIVLEEFLARIELELIHRALARAKGNKSKAAKLLGMTRPRFYRRLETLGLATGEEQP